MVRAGCGPKCRLRAIRWAVGASAACSTACGRSSFACSRPALPIPTRSCGPRPTACWISQPPPPPTGCGPASSRTCPARAAAGSNWPCGSTAARAKSSAGTCARRCPQTWSASPCGAPWPAPGRAYCPLRPKASTRLSALSSCSLAAGRCKAIAGWATARITPTPNRFGAASRPNCSMAAPFSAWPKPGSKSATTSPIIMPNAGTPPSNTTRPTTSKLIFKPRSNSVHLS